MSLSEVEQISCIVIFALYLKFTFHQFQKGTQNALGRQIALKIDKRKRPVNRKIHL